MGIGKRLNSCYESFDSQNLFSVEDAVKIVKTNAKAKFDETIDISMNLGVDPRQSDQMVRGMVSLPSGTGKDVKVAVFAKGDKHKEATEAARNLMVPFPPSSPCIAVFKDGELVHMLERHHIEGRSSEIISDNLKQAFNEFC